MVTSSRKKCFKSLDNASITGYRVLLILKMLLDGPCDDQQINERFSSEPLLSKSLSQDTVYIYMNTLRAVGCEITRPSKSNDFKYILLSHPFGLYLDSDEVDNLKQICKTLSSFDDWRLMINLVNLFEAISDYLSKQMPGAEEFKNKIMSQNFDIEIVSNLEKYCHDKRTIVLEYESPESGLKEIEIIADSLSCENCKLYLWGYNLKLDEIQYLRVDRIKNIKIININKVNYYERLFTVTYKLTGISASIFVPEADERVIKKFENGLLVEAKIKNTFRFIQKVLTYGSDCVILSPEKIKNEVIAKLKSMIDVYD